MPRLLNAPSKPRWNSRALQFAYFTAIGLLFFSYKSLDELARAHHVDWLAKFIEEMTGAYTVAPLFPLLVRFARTTRKIYAHLVGLVVFSLLHTSLMAISRDV